MIVRESLVDFLRLEGRDEFLKLFITSDLVTEELKEKFRESYTNREVAYNEYCVAEIEGRGDADSGLRKRLDKLIRMGSCGTSWDVLEDRLLRDLHRLLIGWDIRGTFYRGSWDTYITCFNIIQAGRRVFL